MFTQKEVMERAKIIAKNKGFSSVWSYIGDSIGMKASHTFDFRKMPKEKSCKCKAKGKEDYWKKVPYIGSQVGERVFCTACCHFVHPNDFVVYFSSDVSGSRIPPSGSGKSNRNAGHADTSDRA